MALELGQQPSLLAGGGAALINYDYFDIADGTGVKEYTAAFIKNQNGSGAYFFDNITFTKSDLSEQNYTTNQSFKELVRINIDTSAYNIPRTVRGEIICSNAWHYYIQSFGGGGDLTLSGALCVTIKKISGSTEITLGSTSGALQVITVASLDTAEDSVYELLRIPVSSTNFKRGDLLRAEVSVKGSISTQGSNGTFDIGIYHNPLSEYKNSSGAIIRIPYKIET